MVGNGLRHFRNQWAVLPKQTRFNELRVSRQKANFQALAVFANASPFRQIVEVNQLFGLRQAQVQHGHHALPACNQFCVGPGMGQQSQGLIQ